MILDMKAFLVCSSVGQAFSSEQQNSTNRIKTGQAHLQAALGSIATGMTLNLLCLNSANTEFLLLGLRPQLNYP